MFTESVRIGCSFPVCYGGMTKYQACLIFHRPFTNFDPDHGSAHLETILLCLSMSCQRPSHLVLYCYLPCLNALSWISTES